MKKKRLNASHNRTNSSISSQGSFGDLVTNSERAMSQSQTVNTSMRSQRNRSRNSTFDEDAMLLEELLNEK